MRNTQLPIYPIFVVSIKFDYFLEDKLQTAAEYMDKHFSTDIIKYIDIEHIMLFFHLNNDKDHEFKRIIFQVLKKLHQIYKDI